LRPGPGPRRRFRASPLQHRRSGRTIPNVPETARGAMRRPDLRGRTRGADPRPDPPVRRTLRGPGLHAGKPVGAKDSPARTGLTARAQPNLAPRALMPTKVPPRDDP